MCGFSIACSQLNNEGFECDLVQALKRRGPDCVNVMQRDLSGATNAGPIVHCIATVLALRGAAIVPQPICDVKTHCFLLWNGEAWTMDGHNVVDNDGEAVFQAILSRPSAENFLGAVGHALARVQGPFAFAFLDYTAHAIIFGRDCLGRRSMLMRRRPFGLSSVAPAVDREAWHEVNAGGIHVYWIDTDTLTETSWRSIQLAPLPDINRNAPPGLPIPALRSEIIRDFQALLLQSLRRRMICFAGDQCANSGARPVAVLFSGGVDCTVLARLAHEVCPPDQVIELLNVAFENPKRKDTAALGTFESCPDRITARASLKELWRVVPSRKWQLVTINVAFAEVETARSRILQLMWPHQTEMDWSISVALHFAARGRGTLDHGRAYESRARVLFSGYAADELLGGYMRHAKALQRGGWAALGAELDLDWQRISERNLGRDDRVMADSGREIRHPYLDEDVVRWILQRPLWEKCIPSSNGAQTKVLLRQLAVTLGIPQAGKTPKRAIQFGTRTAKMYDSKVRGADVSAT